MFGRSYGHRRRGCAHLIENGNVGCPVAARDVDIERCYVCGALDGVVRENGVDFLLCHPRTTLGRALDAEISRMI